MTEEDQRAAVVAEAMTWLRTPYHHRGKLKGKGVDCAMFPNLVYTACGLMEPADFGQYPTQWHLHHDEEKYLNIVLGVTREIDGPPGPGDFVLFKIARTFSHGGIVVAWPMILHSSIHLGGVVLSDADAEGELQHHNGKPRLRRFFSPWGR